MENELDKWKKTGVIEPFGQDENIPAWCTPLVIVGKPDGNVRICGDFRVTLNPNIILESHPLSAPSME